MIIYVLLWKSEKQMNEEERKRRERKIDRWKE